MKKKNRPFNLSLQFALGTMFTIFLSATISSMFVGFLLFTGVISRPTPWAMIGAFFPSSLIVGLFFSFHVNKRSFKEVNEVLKAVSKIGEGNFDVTIDIKKGHQDLIEIAQNINQMAKNLKRIEVLRKDFIQNFSHEFKTPIVSISGFAKRLLTKELSEEKKKEYLEIILEESSRLSDLSNSTLSITKLDSMDTIDNKSSFYLDDQIRQCIALLEKQWQAKELSFDVILPKTNFYGNEELLKQVWINLIDNAIKFSKHEGTIKIKLCQASNGIVVSISDNGLGMDEPTIQKIFDKYYQGDASRSTQGNGLGLSIVHRIVDLCSGEITVKSILDKGSTFTVSLPKEEPPNP